jgi:hypothetical protein
MSWCHFLHHKRDIHQPLKQPAQRANSKTTTITLLTVQPASLCCWHGMPQGMPAAHGRGTCPATGRTITSSTISLTDLVAHSHTRPQQHLCIITQGPEQGAGMPQVGAVLTACRQVSTGDAQLLPHLRRAALHTAVAPGPQQWPQDHSSGPRTTAVAPGPQRHAC